MSSYANFVCDLHGHTNRSDGSDTPIEFLQHAADRKMKVVAITDHDKIPPEAVQTEQGNVDIVKYADSLGLKLIKGIEISCETYIEEVHIVCFGCDWDAPFFKELDEFTTRSKIDSDKELVNRLDGMGMKMIWEEVLTANGTRIPETEVQKKMIFNLIANKGYVNDWKDAKLLVKKDKNLTIYREKPDAAEVIHEVHRQGGIAILAHPYLVSEEVSYQGKRISRTEFINLLIYEGLDGIEARYTYDKTSYNGSKNKFEIYEEILSQFGGRIPIISGGSDYHADGKKGVEDPREIGECGLTESEFYQNPILRGLV